MAFRRFVPIFIIGLLLIGGKIANRAQSQSATTRPIVAWVGANQLWVSDTAGNARLLVDGNVEAASLSPDRSQIAYHTREDLTILAVDSGEVIATLATDVLTPNPEIPESTPQFSTPYWISETTLWLNTLDFFTAGYGYENRYDIQQWRIAENQLTEIAPPGAGGIFIPSPDRSKMAVYRPGYYQDTSNRAVIEIWDVATGEILGEPNSFVTVATGSEVDWYPNITWSASGNAIGFSIPNPDLLYFAPDALPATQICIMAVLEKVDCQEYVISFPAQPIFNADLSQWVAFQPTQSSWALVVGASDENLRTIARESLLPGIVGNIIAEPILWLDESHVLIRAILENPFRTQMVNIDITSGEAEAWPDETTAEVVLNLQPLGQDFYAIVYGDFSRTQVMIYDEKTRASILLTMSTPTENIGWVAFALR